MLPTWFKPRKYKHLDVPVGATFAKRVSEPAYICLHSFSPLIKYEKIEKRYKLDPDTETRILDKKPRPIMYASHRDACILSYYSFLLSNRLEDFYQKNNLEENIIAYRSIGKSNYDFSADALTFSVENSPVMIMAFDVRKFFDTLDHVLLKNRLCNILNETILPADWYKIYRFVTNFHFVELRDIKQIPQLKNRLRDKSAQVIATISELKNLGIKINKNPELISGNFRGIPQGTPISATLSNLYMIDFDVKMKMFCDDNNAYYRRYSDDILIICKPEYSEKISKFTECYINNEKLEVSVNKTEKTLFDPTVYGSATKAAQYLGFLLRPDGATIRESSLARQWRKLRRAIRRARKSAQWRKRNGSLAPAHTKQLLRRFTLIAVSQNGSVRHLRNFASYAKRSAKAFDGNEKILKQIKKLDRTARIEIAKIKKL